MKAPLSWLKEFVDIALPPAQLASRLALTGTEVERVTPVGVSFDEDILERFVVGKVRACESHPDADRLSVCTVDAGEGADRTIVCGAPNVAAGQTVAVSLPGAVLPSGMSIGEAKLRGVRSAGMILSEDELGIGADAGGILVLPDGWEAGDLLADYLPIADTVFEIEVTPNRPDCLSIRGLAREIGVITGEDFDEELSFSFPLSDRSAADDITVEVWDPDLCPRYAARVIRGVSVDESPAWLKTQLMRAGMRPVNNVVDVTNYVMWSLGQPLHAFDLETIRGSKVIARRARAGEEIVTLDGTPRTLSDEMLVIADAERASVVAGVMGSLDSEVTDETVNILLEAANFSGPSILRTSAELGLRSESSTRFEKGLDPNMIPLALDMACSLLHSLCGGEVSEGTVDVAQPLPESWTLRLRPARVEDVVGMAVPPAEMETILGALGCNVVDEDDALSVEVPTFRADLEREIDLIEEVARIHGLDQVPATLSARRQGRGGLTRRQKLVRNTENALSEIGLSEVITYSFGGEHRSDFLRLATDDSRRGAVKVTNPLSGEQSEMRTLLLPGLLETAAANQAVREDRVHLFEIGKIFRPSGEELPDEPLTLGILMAGEWTAASWHGRPVEADFFLGKGVVQRVCSVLHVEAAFARAEEPFLHPGKSARVSVGGEEVGWIGEVHARTADAFSVEGPVVAGELALGRILAHVPAVVLFEDLVTYPPVGQDVSLVVDADVPAADLLTAICEGGGDLLRSAHVFDVYEGAPVPEGKKSVAVHLSFRSAERTLSEKEVNETRERMLEHVGKVLGASLRT